MVDGPARLLWAARISHQHVRTLGSRAEHVLRVARLASEVGRAFGPDREPLVAAAYLHDIGYNPEITVTGFHPLDGARVIRAAGEERLARLVAHHSGARHEAQLRGIQDYLVEFPFDDSELDQALTYCDLTTGPDGRRLRLEDRVAEIRSRYGPGHLVTKAIMRGVPEFERAREVVESRIAAAGIVLSGSLAYP